MNSENVIVGYAYIAKGSGELVLVKNSDMFNLKHVFPIYAKKIDLDTKTPETGRKET